MGKIVITGDRGFLGTHLRKKYPSAKGYDLEDGLDVLETETLGAHLEGADTVVHLAAFISVEESKQQPIKYIKNNVEGTMSVIKAAIASKVKRIIYASSAAVYAPYSSPYAMTKLAGEHLLHCYKDLIHTTSLRFFNIYGEGQNLDYGAVITAFKKGMNNGEITIYGDGEQTRDFVAVEDVINAVSLAMKADTKSGERFDIGTGRETSVNELAEFMSVIMKKNPKVISGPSRTEIKYSRASIDKATKLLGYKPTVSLRSGLKKLL